MLDKQFIIFDEFLIESEIDLIKDIEYLDKLIQSTFSNYTINRYNNLRHYCLDIIRSKQTVRKYEKKGDNNVRK